ncbi:MAG: hypothetical protein AAF727_12190 [Pseudomonadota bacterium]
MKLVHISDIHLTVPGELMGGLDPHARFAQALAHVQTHHSDAVRVIITGDLTHWGEAAANDALAAALDGIGQPVRRAPSRAILLRTGARGSTRSLPAHRVRAFSCITTPCCWAFPPKTRSPSPPGSPPVLRPA